MFPLGVDILSLNSSSTYKGEQNGQVLKARQDNTAAKLRQTQPLRNAFTCGGARNSGKDSVVERAKRLTEGLFNLVYRFEQLRNRIFHWLPELFLEARANVVAPFRANTLPLR